MRKLIRVILYSVLSIIVVVGLGAAANFTYLKRTFTGFSSEQVRDISWFEPKAEMVPALSSETLDRTGQFVVNQDERFSEAISYAEGINSSAFLIWHDGQIIAEKYWSPYGASSYTQTHSIHKSLLGMAVGIALEEGDIGSLDDPVSDYLGPWIDQSMGEIRVEHLLNMSSGLGKEPAKIFFFDHFLRLLNATDISKVARSLPQKVPPGQEFEYINNNPQLLIDVLEKATGVSYEDYLQDKIWSKMAANPGYLWMDREGGTPHGYCCLMALPDDLLRIGLLMLNKGRVNGQQIVSEKWIDQMIAPSELNPNYGYLIWRGSPHTPMRKYSAASDFSVLHSEPYLADDLLYFDGFGGQRVYIVPSRNLVIVRVGEVKFDFDDAILPNRIIEALDMASDLQKTFDVVHEDMIIETEHSGPVDVRVSYPKDSAATHPLIIFSHGHYLTNTDYHALTDAWVERGYVVAAPLHLDTGDMKVVQELGEKLGSDWISAARVLDMLAVLDQAELMTASLPGFDGDVRVDKVIAAGHSFGALSAQMIAGAKSDRLGNSIYPIPEQLSDDRIVAVVAISPPGLVPGYLSEMTWQDLSAPQLVVTGTKDVFEHVWTDYREHIISYSTAVPGDNYLLVLDGMDHYLGNLIGRLDRDEAPQLLALDNLVERSLLFMDSYLGDESSGVSMEQLNNFEDVIPRPGVTTYERR